MTSIACAVVRSADVSTCGDEDTEQWAHADCSEGDYQVQLGPEAALALGRVPPRRSTASGPGAAGGPVGITGRERGGRVPPRPRDRSLGGAGVEEGQDVVPDAFGRRAAVAADDLLGDLAGLELAVGQLDRLFADFVGDEGLR